MWSAFDDLDIANRDNALGEEAGVGIGITERTAMSAARVKAQDVKKPKAFCTRVMVLCMMASAIGDFA